MNTAARSTQSTARTFGQQTMASVFAAFALLLLRRAQERGIRHLAFVARDGLFLGQVTETLIETLAWPDAPSLGEVYLSRLSTNLVGREMGVLDETAFADAQGVKGDTFTLDAFLRYYGLDSAATAPYAAPLGLVSDTPLRHFEQVAPLLQSPAFRQLVQTTRQQQRGLLKRYLGEQGLLASTNTAPATAPAALVDIGWRGTIPTTLDRAFTQDPDYRPLPCFYLGYWHELGCLPLAEGRIDGLLADQRRGRQIREGAAYYLSLLLEAICRPDQGPTLGYALAADGASVAPIIAPHNPGDLERHAQAQSAAIRHGILTGVAALGQDWRHASPDSESLRRQTQHQLRRLAFFPPAHALVLAQALCHTEGHHNTWCTRLLPTHMPRPWQAPKAWLAGLSAPWRSGYVAASGGPLVAGLFYGLEATLQTFPTGVRQSLRELVLGLAGKPR